MNTSSYHSVPYYIIVSHLIFNGSDRLEARVAQDRVEHVEVVEVLGILMAIAVVGIVVVIVVVIVAVTVTVIILHPLPVPRAPKLSTMTII